MGKRQFQKRPECFIGHNISINVYLLNSSLISDCCQSFQCKKYLLELAVYVKEDDQDYDIIKTFLSAESPDVVKVSGSIASYRI